MLVPAYDPGWQAVWLEGNWTQPGVGGGLAGFLTGMAIVQSVPLVLLFWPAAVGVVAGTTALGVWGGQMDRSMLARLEPADRATLLEAAVGLHPDRLLRGAAAESLSRRTGQPPPVLLWHQTWGPDTRGTDPLALARDQGADGVMHLALEAFGLAVGEESETFGVFIRVRARVLASAGGGVRYERVLEHGPGRPLAGLPRATGYTLEFLTVDQARVFRQEVQMALAAVARLLAEDPALPLAAR